MSREIHILDCKITDHSVQTPRAVDRTPEWQGQWHGTPAEMGRLQVEFKRSPCLRGQRGLEEGAGQAGTWQGDCPAASGVRPGAGEPDNPALACSRGDPCQSDPWVPLSLQEATGLASLGAAEFCVLTYKRLHVTGTEHANYCGHKGRGAGMFLYNKCFQD